VISQQVEQLILFARIEQPNFKYLQWILKTDINQGEINVTK
jgi:hypothetical protein